MPKQRRSRGNSSTTTAKQTGRGRSTSGAVPSQPLTNNLSVNYTAMPTETLRVMLSQRHLSQTGSRLALIARLQESDSPGNIPATSAPPVSDQLSAMITSIVDARLAILHPRSEPEPDSAQALPSTESLVPVPTDQVLEPTPPPTQFFNDGQDGGHNRANGAHSSIDLGDPEDVASIHSSYRLPSLASHLSNHQISAITNGEYVDLASLLPFSSLLRDRVNSNLKLQVGNEGLTIPLPSPAQRPKINSIDRWLDAFAIYSSVILSSYPSRGADLFSYQQLIRESARKFPGMAWYVYDVEFRRRASHNLSKKWGERDVQLYLDTFTGLPKAIICKSCSSSDHFTDSCPLSPRSKDSQGPNRAELCYNFNKGVPCARTPCLYRHQCNKPGCTAAHSGKDHDDLSPSGSQPKPTSRSSHSSRSRT